MADDLLTRKKAEMEGLLPCPFCECLAGLHEQRNVFPDGAGWRVECEGACHAMTCYWHNPTDATTYWNKRALSLESVREAALEEAAKVCDMLGRSDAPTDRLIGYDIAAESIRALQHAPARVAEGGATTKVRLPSLPQDIQEWCWHMDLHITEHDERHAGLALRAAWPHVSKWLKSVVGPSSIRGKAFYDEGKV